MRVAVIQMNSRNDKAANLREARRLALRAVEREHADLIAFPETFAFMGGSVAERHASAEAFPDGEAYTFLREFARAHRVWVHGGSMFEREGERVFNTTVVFDRDGREVARYRKIHLFDVTTPDGRSYRESDVVARGSDIVTYEAEGVTVGCSICYDLRFAELYLELARRGAELILVPAAFTRETGRDHWELLLRARAVETQCYVAAPAQWGPFPTEKGTAWTYGRSMIVGPWGQVLAQVQDGTGVASVELDLDYLRRVRELVPVAQHRVLVPGAR